MNIAIAEKFLTSLQLGDVSAAIALLHNNACWVQPGDTRLSGEHRGKVAVVNLIGSFAQLGISLELTEAYQCDDDILCRIIIHHAIGKRHEFQLIRLEDELIHSVRHYGDSQYLSEIFAADDRAGAGTSGIYK